MEVFALICDTRRTTEPRDARRHSLVSINLRFAMGTYGITYQGMLPTTTYLLGKEMGNLLRLWFEDLAVVKQLACCSANDRGLYYMSKADSPIDLGSPWLSCATSNSSKCPEGCLVPSAADIAREVDVQSSRCARLVQPFLSCQVNDNPDPKCLAGAVKGFT